MLGLAKFFNVFNCELFKDASVTWIVLRGTNCKTFLRNYMLFISFVLERILKKAVVAFFEVLCRSRGIKENFRRLSQSSVAPYRYILSRPPKYISIEELKIKKFDLSLYTP